VALNPPAVPDDRASVLDDVADRVRTELVNEMSAARDLAQDDVHFLSRFEAPDFGLAADGAGGVGRAGVDGLLDRQPEREHAELEDEEHRADHGASGVKIGAQGQGGPGFDQVAGRRPLVEHQEERNSRQEKGDGWTARQGANSVRRNLDEVLGRDGPDFGRELGRSQGREFVAVNFNSEPGPLGGRDQTARFLETEDAPLAEDVEEIGQPTHLDGRHEPVDQKIEIGVRPVPVLGRDVVGAHEGRNDVDRMEAVDLGQDFELLDFVVEVESVAALGLDGRRPLEEHPVEALEAEAGQLVARDGPGRRDRRPDSHPLLGELSVSPALEAQPELANPVAREGKVGVAVHESGQGDEIPPVDPFGLVPGDDLVPEFRLAAYEHDPALEGCDPAILDGAAVAERVLPLGQRAAAGEELGAVPDDEVGPGHDGFFRRAVCRDRRMNAGVS